MTQQDLSSPEHRVENLSRHQFVRAYAELHTLIHDPKWANNPVSDLKLVCEVLDVNIAQKFDLTVMTLRKMLGAVTDPEQLFKTGNGPAESSAG